MFVSMAIERVGDRAAPDRHAHAPAGVQDQGAACSARPATTSSRPVSRLCSSRQPFWVVDGNLTATVEDVIVSARQLKLDSIWIDGAYLLQHPEGQGPLCQGRENCDLIKELSGDRPDRLLVAVQRAEGYEEEGDQEGRRPRRHRLFGRHRPAFDLVLGLFEDETVETLKQRAGQGAERARWKNPASSRRRNFHFDTMDFGQVEEEGR